MNPQRFEAGQAVTPNTRAWNEMGEKTGAPPKVRFGEIYHVARYFSYPNDDNWYITLQEIGNYASYLETKFDPLEISDAQIKELVSQSVTLES